MDGSAATLSIILCTTGKSKIFEECLESLILQDFNHQKLEIIIIDNLPNNNTKSLVERYSKKSKFRVKYINEPEIGLSKARNRGINEASGKYLAFIDDDAIAVKGWAMAIMEAFKFYKADVVGGPIFPTTRGETKLPAWMRREQMGWQSVLDYGNVAKKITAFPYFFGANMAYKKQILEEAGKFRDDLGRKDTSLLGGEDTHIQIKIIEMGGVLWYTPEAIVYHLVSEDRLKLRNLAKRAFWSGRTIERLNIETIYFGNNSWSAISRLSFATLKEMLSSLVRRDKNMSLWCSLRLLEVSGYIVERLGRKHSISDCEKKVDSGRNCKKKDSELL